MRTWIKLYTEIVSDPKMGRLTDRQFRVCINLFALAGVEDHDGLLPTTTDLAWHLRMSVDDLANDLQALAQVGIIAAVDDVWLIAKWQDRQARSPSAQPEAVLERVRRYRNKAAAERNADSETCNEDVTSLQSDCNATREEKNRDREDKKRAEQIASSSTPPAAKASKTPKPPDPTLSNPAVQTYRELCRITPAPIVRESIAATVTDNPHWRQVITAWLSAGYKPANITGMLEWYLQGIPTRSKANGRSATHLGPGLQGIAGSAADERWRAANADPAAVAEAAATTF